MFRALSSFGGQTYFGAEVGQLVSGRWLNSIIDITLRVVFGDKFGFIAYSFIFFFVSFLYTYKIARKFLKEEIYSFSVALFYAFNPLSLFFLSQTGMMLSYSFVPAFFNSFIDFFENEDFTAKNLFIFTFSILIIFTNIRIFGFVCIVLIILFIIRFRYYYHFFTHRLNRVLVLILILFLSFLPVTYFYVSDLGSPISEKNGSTYLYRVPDSNYLYDISYENSKNESFYSAFYLKEVYDNFSVDFIRQRVVVVYSLIFLGFITYLFFRGVDDSRYDIGIKILYILCIFLFNFAHFFSRDIFFKFTYSYFPILSFSTAWVSILLLFVLTLLLIRVFDTYSQEVKRVVFLGTIIYVLLSIAPISFDNTYTETASIEDVPSEYLDTFSPVLDIESTLFIPSPNTKFNWLPYRINLAHNNSSFEYLDDNVRYRSVNYRDLYAEIRDGLSCNVISNLWLFNIKSIPLFLDTEEDSSWKFITPTTTHRLKTLLESCGENLDSFEDGNISLYKPHDYEKWDYLLYSPHKIYFEDSYNVLLGDKLFQKGSLFLNKDANQRIGYAEDDLLNGKELEIKKSRYNRHKFYIRINDVNPSESFFIHLSQTFSSSWKFKWISKDEYENVPCLDNYLSYDLSNNKYCNYEEKVILLDDLKYLKRSEIEEKNHFFGNFSGNTWLVETDKISSDYKSEDGDLYAVVIYDKQIVFSVLLYISVVTLFILLLLTLVSSIIKLIRRKNITI